MAQISIEEIFKILQSDRKFFHSLQDQFTKTLEQNISQVQSDLLSSTALKTLLVKLFTLFFRFDDDPTDELYQLCKKMAQNDIDLKPIIIKSLLNTIGQYALYLAENGASLGKLKSLIVLIDIYMGTIDKAYMDYMNELKKELNEKEHIVDEIIFSSLQNIYLKNDEIQIIYYFKELPVVLKATITKLNSTKGEVELFIKRGESGHLKKEKICYLKHSSLSKPIKTVIKEFHPIEERIVVSHLEFSDIPQEKRKYVRVQPDEVIDVQIKIGDKVFLGHIHDISVGGVGILIDDARDLEPGKMVELSFTLSNEPVEIKGIIRHVTSHEHLTLFGVEFMYDNDPRSVRIEEIISSYVVQRQFEILKELKAQ